MGHGEEAGGLPGEAVTLGADHRSLPRGGQVGFARRVPASGDAARVRVGVEASRGCRHGGVGNPAPEQSRPSPVRCFGVRLRRAQTGVGWNRGGILASTAADSGVVPRLRRPGRPMSSWVADPARAGVWAASAGSLARDPGGPLPSEWLVRRSLMALERNHERGLRRSLSGMRMDPGGDGFLGMRTAVRCPMEHLRDGGKVSQVLPAVVGHPVPLLWRMVEPLGLEGSGPGQSHRILGCGQEVIYERHRHRFEVNNAYRDVLSEAGLVFSGLSPDRRLVEIADAHRGEAWA